MSLLMALFGCCLFMQKMRTKIFHWNYYEDYGAKLMTEPKRDINQELLESIEHVKAYKRGEMEFRTTVLTPTEVTPPKVIRERLHLTQEQFALRLRVSVRTLQDWEQGRRKPTGPALSLLRIADQEPDVFLKVR